MAILAKTQLVGIERCPQCGIARPNIVFKSSLLGSGDVGGSTSIWLTYQCTACLCPVIVEINMHLSAYNPEGIHMMLFGKEFPVASMLPGLDDVHGDIPDRARSYLRQAIESLSSPDGSVMLAASAVDAMLKQKGLANGTLYSRIGTAVESHILTHEMGEWAHSIRLEANNPRHADLEDPHATPAQARAAVDFAKALAEFLFVLPARVQRGREATPHNANQAAPSKAL